jgi:hypothetical protein
LLAYLWLEIAVGQVVGDGVTIDMGPAAVTGSIYLCLELRSDIPLSPIYNIPDFAAFDANGTDPFSILESPDAALVNGTKLCGTIALRSGERSYIPILRYIGYGLAEH